RRVCRFETSLAIDIACAHFDRVYPQGVSQPRDHDLAGEMRLRCAKTSKGATGNIVGIDSVSIYSDVRDFVAATGKQRGYLEYLGAGRSVSATISDHFSFHGGNAAVLSGPPLALDMHRVPFMVTKNRLFAGPYHCRRTLELPGRQSQKRLYRQIFTTSEGSADASIADDYLLFGKLEDARDLAAVLVHPLSRRLDHKSTLAIDISNPCLCL